MSGRRPSELGVQVRRSKRRPRAVLGRWAGASSAWATSRSRPPRRGTRRTAGRSGIGLRQWPACTGPAGLDPSLDVLPAQSGGGRGQGRSLQEPLELAGRLQVDLDSPRRPVGRPQGALPQADVDPEALAYTDTRALAPGPAFRSRLLGHARPFGQPKSCPIIGALRGAQGAKSQLTKTKVQVRACLEG